MEKVTLTKEQAQAIELAKVSSVEINNVLTGILTGRKWLHEYKFFNEMNLDTICRAIYIGYEVVKTPEEKLLKYYNACEIKAKAIIQHTLECLDITVKGIND